MSNERLPAAMDIPKSKLPKLFHKGIPKDQKPAKTASQGLSNVLEKTLRCNLPQKCKIVEHCFTSFLCEDAGFNEHRPSEKAKLFQTTSPHLFWAHGLSKSFRRRKIPAARNLPMNIPNS